MMFISRLVAVAIWLVFAARIVNAALNLDGTQAVKPLDDGDPSPIGDPTTYYPDQHHCPLPCADYANMHSWISYHSVERLQRCKEPMLLQLSVTQSLNDPASSILIRSCTLRLLNVTARTTLENSSSNLQPMTNPKKSIDLFLPSLNIAPACSFGGTPSPENMEVITSSDTRKRGIGNVDNLLKGLQKFFEAPDNCDETFAFAYHGQTIAGIYIGPGLGKATATSALEALRASNPLSNRTITQLCEERDSSRLIGIAIDTTGDLSAIQKIALEWSRGHCFTQNDLIPEMTLAIEAFNITGFEGTIETHNSSIADNGTVIPRMYRDRKRSPLVEDMDRLNKRATCSYTRVVSGDGCGSLVSRCGISAADLAKYNPKANLCSTLQVGDYICCSAGDPFTEPKPDPPKQGRDGVCATHLIQNGDTCDALGKRFGVTIADLEKWNKGKSWAWTECKNMLLGYNMCLSDGKAGLPPPQAGTECGPLVPGTLLSPSTLSIAGLNPCPLKACCSNWGFCGVFPAHCEIHAPKDGGPGSKLDGFANTCVSNCGDYSDIKQNSGPPETFSRVGYYTSFNFDRDCLWLSAKDANTDGSYTHIHWAFAEIDQATWKPVIKESRVGQWDEFKALTNVKKIVSIGGWAASTEAATYNIMRAAIITNYNEFTRNLAIFVKEHGLDGIDIDWEYPGAPDILVGGAPIGKKTDGNDYLIFLTVLKQELGTDHSVSIAAPASYWYLKAFPIDRIADVIDYIVYMTYDLHGQWDAGNPNAYDQCDSGRCIRSHVNLTETRNSLAIITKAGVPNNKIFVGEASYGRSFHMATDGCWGPMCDFTGTRIQSDAKPGRCTKTSGYLGNAEINELISRGGAEQIFHDAASNSDIMLYQGDYVSYMTPTTKETRRADWKSLNFAGSIDWALDLQTFTADDMAKPPEIPNQGQEGCVAGEDRTVNSADLCDFSCSLGFCPEPLCFCTDRGIVQSLPHEINATDVIAWDEDDIDMNRLCLFACKYKYCPEEVCTTISKVDVDVVVSEESAEEAARRANANLCLIYQDPSKRDGASFQCYAFCEAALNEAQKAGRTSNYGCVGLWDLDKPIPWDSQGGTTDSVAYGKCFCDNWTVNEIADTVIEALPIIAEIGCYILMSSLKLVLDIGLEAIPGVGKALDAGLDMATTAAQMASYLYPEEEDPEGAFNWWLSPCGGTTLVPDQIKTIFGILDSVASGVSSFKPPKNLPKGKGKKGDPANPVDQSTPRKPPSGPAKGDKPKNCNVPKASSTQRRGHTLREQKCVGTRTEATEWIVTSVIYAANAVPTPVTVTCKDTWRQACWHYSSAIRQNPSWSTLTCPPEAGTTERSDLTRKVPKTWMAQHNGRGWWDLANRPRPEDGPCQADEYPPLYFLQHDDAAYVNGGTNAPGGQLVRSVPRSHNSGAAQKWRAVCFRTQVTKAKISDRDLKNAVDAGPVDPVEDVATNKRTFKRYGKLTVHERPEFSIEEWPPAAVNDGLNENPCWPQNMAPQDPGFALLSNDPYYNANPPVYNYRAAYQPPGNGG